MTEGLKGCAHCGGETNAIKGPDKIHPYRITCRDCGASTAWHGDYVACMKAWNTRPSTPPAESDDQGFCKTVWEALKGDHTDLRRQAIILNACRELIQRREQQAAEAMRERAAKMIEALGLESRAALIRDIPAQEASNA